MAHLAAQDAPELGGAAVDDHIAILGVVAAAGSGRCIAVAVFGGNLAGGKVYLHHAGFRHHAAVGKGYVDLLSLAGHIPIAESRQNTDDQIQSAHHIAEGGAAANRVGIRPAGDAHNAPGLGHGVVTGTAAVGSCCAEAGDGTVNQTGIDLLQGFIAQAKLLHGAGPEVLNEDIHVFHQLQKYILSLLQIQSDALLAAVEVFVIAADTVFHRCEISAVVAGSGLLQLNHLGAQIPQQCAGGGGCQHTSHVQDADSFQCRLHNRAPFFSPFRCPESNRRRSEEAHQRSETGRDVHFSAVWQGYPPCPEAACKFHRSYEFRWRPRDGRST